MRRLLVNDALNQLGERTFWADLLEWFNMEFVSAPFPELADTAAALAKDATLIVRNASWFGPIETTCPQIALLQDIIESGAGRAMQGTVLMSARAAVFNSEFTASKYQHPNGRVIPLPVDFSLFEPRNAMGLQQALSLPDSCVCWVGASQGAAGHIKGFDTFLQVVRANPDISFVAVFKDAAPEYGPPNLRSFTRLPQEDLAKVIGACRVGLCTSRTESQHLAGIEMGACGLPLVVPPIGCYWKRKDWPGCEVLEYTPAAFMQGIRASLGKVEAMREQVRDYWRREFDKSIVRSAWENLVREVECSGAS